MQLLGVVYKVFNFAEEELLGGIGCIEMEQGPLPKAEESFGDRFAADVRHRYATIILDCN